jgi:hypothetical protein
MLTALIKNCMKLFVLFIPGIQHPSNIQFLVTIITKFYGTQKKKKIKFTYNSIIGET